MSRYVKSRFHGVSYKAHKKRVYADKKDQRYYVEYTDRAGTIRRDVVGYASQGWTVTKVHWLLRALKQNIRTGAGPQSLEEWKEAENTLTASVITWDWYQPYWQEIKKLPILERD